MRLVFLGEVACLGAAVWTDPEVGAEAAGFSPELMTLRIVYVRLRFDEFVRFFEAAGVEIQSSCENYVRN
jgi:hypothetical protein